MHNRAAREEDTPGDDPSASGLLRAELREKERMLATLIANLPGMVYRCRNDEHWTMELVSDGCLELTGYEPQDLLFNSRISYEKLTHPADSARVREAIQSAIAQRRRFSVEYRIVCRDGAVKWVSEAGVGLGRDGRPGAIEGFVQDISERKAAEAALRDAERRFRDIFENATEGIFQSTIDGHYIHVNPALARIYGYETAVELIASLRNIGAQLYVEEGRREEFANLVRSRGVVQGFVSQVYRRNGEVIWISENARCVYDEDGAFSHYEGTVVDVSNTRRYEEQLRYQASHDALTHLPNRALLYDRLAQAIAYARRHGGLVAVAFIDLDHFKRVNDSLGHETGDLLLKSVAERMSACLRESDTVARQGGDEFVLVLASERDERAVAGTLDRIRHAIGEPWSAQHRVLHVTCSIGATLFPNDGIDPGTLLKNADLAMYEAKAAGRNVIRFFTGEMVSATLQRVDMEHALRQGLERDEFEVYFQPRCDLATGRVVGMEALARWRPSGELVGPEAFIPVAEETGLIVPLGEHVLRTACAFNQSLMHTRGAAPLTVAVNLSVRQLHDRDFVSTLARILEETGLDPQHLEVEITESLMMHDIEHCIATCEALDRLGIYLAVDDFGTGHSSLSYLKRLPVDRIKIDRSFVRDIATDEDDAAIVRALIVLAHSLGIRVVAEGVETAGQAAFLRANGCDEVQGFYFGQPVPSGEFLALVEAAAGEA